MKNNILSELRSKNGLQTGTGATITLVTLIAIYSLSIVTSLPGLAVSPILAELQHAFPKSTEFELQMLESLPSLIIIPFILLSGKLSLYFSIRKLVLWGLALYTVSAIVYLLPISMGLMLFNSALLGIGAGMVIPFSTGLMAHYFTGSRRTQQLGYSSAISNFSLVIATAVAGYLADINWHLPFLVYSVSVVSLILATRMAKTKKTTDEVKAENTKNKKISVTSYLGGRIKTDWPLGLMIFYFIINIVILVIPMNISIFMEHYKIGSSDLFGTLMSIFFLSITLPGFFINKLVGKEKDRNSLLWIGVTVIGVVFVMYHTLWSIIVGIILMGLGYGVIQPLIYDRTSERTTTSRITFHLSLVMTMNYLPIIVYPFIQSFIENITTKNVMTPMIMSLTLGLVYWIYYFIKLTTKKRIVKSQISHK